MAEKKQKKNLSDFLNKELSQIPGGVDPAIFETVLGNLGNLQNIPDNIKTEFSDVLSKLPELAGPPAPQKPENMPKTFEAYFRTEIAKLPGAKPAVVNDIANAFKQLDEYVSNKEQRLLNENSFLKEEAKKYADRLNIKISDLFSQMKTPQTKDEYIQAFRNGFLKFYDNLTQAQISQIDNFIQEDIAKKASKYFPGGKFDKLTAKMKCVQLLGLPVKTGDIQLYLDISVTPDQFQGIETVKDLIKAYSKIYAKHVGLEADAASAKAKYTADVAGLEAKLTEKNTVLAGKEKEFADKEAQHKTQITDAEEKYKKQETQHKVLLADAEKKYKEQETQHKTQLTAAEKKYTDKEKELQDITAKFTKADNEKRDLERELSDLKARYQDEINTAKNDIKNSSEFRIQQLKNAFGKEADDLIRSFCKPGMPAEVRINAYLKYMETKPGNLCIAGIVHNNIGAILGNEFKRYEEAKEHLIKAVSFAQQECIADPSNVSAKERLEKYEYRLEDCIYNIKKMKSSPDRTFIIAA